MVLPQSFIVVNVNILKRLKNNTFPLPRQGYSINKMDKTIQKIYFEDRGQDFLVWTLDKEGFVINSEPFQKSIWEGTQVILGSIKIGYRPKLVFKEDLARKGVRGVKDISELNYQVIKVKYSGGRNSSRL